MNQNLVSVNYLDVSTLWLSSVLNLLCLLVYDMTCLSVVCVFYVRHEINASMIFHLEFQCKNKIKNNHNRKSTPMWK
jgi:hypothetical protein